MSEQPSTEGISDNMLARLINDHRDPYCKADDCDTCNTRHALEELQRLRAAPEPDEQRGKTFITPTADEVRDAARYGWLKRQFRVMSPHMDGQHHWSLTGHSQFKGESIDAICDAGIARCTATTKEEKQ